MTLAAIGGCTRGSTSGPSADAGVLAAAIDASIGCHDNWRCGPDQYCAFQPGLCGKGEKAGSCRSRPAVCPGSVIAPVCGGDRNIYESECEAHTKGVDLAVMGQCGGRMPDWIPCGKQFCDVRRDYCAIYLSDVFDLPTDYFCRPLPAS